MSPQVPPSLPMLNGNGLYFCLENKTGVNVSFKIFAFRWKFFVSKVVGQ